VLQSAAELVPVPLLKDALGVAIKVIEVCEVSTYFCAQSIQINH